MRLDIGCGNKPSGDVNCDLHVKDVCNHRARGTSDRIQTKNIPNFVICDAQYLPFRDDLFDDVFSAQVIEHVKNPQLMVKEIARVATKKIIIETQHRAVLFVQWRWKDRRWTRKHHINNMNFDYLIQIGKMYGCELVRTYTLNYAYFPNRYLPWVVVPSEIGVEFKKNG